MNSQKHIGNRIKKIRNDHDLSQIELAEMLSISQASVGHYENGKRRPPIKILIMLSKIGNVSLDWLIRGTENPPHSTYHKQNINMVNETNPDYITNNNEYRKLITILEKDKKLKKLIFNIVFGFKRNKEDLNNLRDYLYNEISSE